MDAASRRMSPKLTANKVKHMGWHQGLVGSALVATPITPALLRSFMHIKNRKGETVLPRKLMYNDTVVIFKG